MIMAWPLVFVFMLLVLRGLVAVARDIQSFIRARSPHVPDVPPLLPLPPPAPEPRRHHHQTVVIPRLIKLCTRTGEKDHHVGCAEVDAERGRVIKGFSPCLNCEPLLRVP